MACTLYLSPRQTDERVIEMPRRTVSLIGRKIDGDFPSVVPFARTKAKGQVGEEIVSKDNQRTLAISIYYAIAPTGQIEHEF